MKRGHPFSTYAKRGEGGLDQSYAKRTGGRGVKTKAYVRIFLICVDFALFAIRVLDVMQIFSWFIDLIYLCHGQNSGILIKFSLIFLRNGNKRTWKLHFLHVQSLMYVSIQAPSFQSDPVHSNLEVTQNKSDQDQ